MYKRQVAGVVNIILKDDFEGLSVEVMEGAYDAGDGETSLASVTFGAQFADGRGSSIFNIRTDEQGRVLAEIEHHILVETFSITVITLKSMEFRLGMISL